MQISQGLAAVIPKAIGMVCVGFLVFIALLTQLYYQQQKLLHTHQWVVHTFLVQDASHKLNFEVLEAASAVRGYLLTGDAVFLPGYQQLNAKLFPLYNQLENLTQDNPLQKQFVKDLQSLLQQRVALNQTMVEGYKGFTITDKAKLIFDSQQLNQSINSLLAQFRSEESRLLSERESQMQHNALLTLFWNGLIVAILCAIAVYLAWSLYKQWRQSQAMLAELAALNCELDSRNANLQAANQAISDADRLKTEFLSAMSHELRTPLNSIIGFTGILRMGIAGDLSDEQKKQLRMVNDSAQHLLHLINDLLDLSRIESGRAELSEDRFDLREVVAETLATLEPMATRKNLVLVNNCQDRAMPLLSDRRKVYQILLNLVNNALKFSDHGAVIVSCHASQQYWRICVSDQGIGIKPENLPALFQAFHQIDGSARRVYEGTGLGLYLCKRLVEMLGGEIFVSSEPGKGSQFCFSLPKPAALSGEQA